ncbi:MAG: THUMP domain-containing class I SAM-dependent RNA methyltransferase [Ottowia sp.]
MSSPAAAIEARWALFLPCAAGAQEFLADEVHGLTGLAGQDLLVERAGVYVRGGWREVMLLNLHSRLAQRVLIELAHAPCPHEDALYALTASVPWEQWLGPRHTFRVDVTSHGSAFRSLQFAALRVKDAVADRFRQRQGQRPSVDTHAPDVRIHLHLSARHASLLLDTSGDALFKRGWRQDKGDAPLKETLAAAMLAACGWWQPAARSVSPLPLYDPCCGSGTIVIEAAQLALGLPAGGQRTFAFERLPPFDAALRQQWQEMKAQATPADPAANSPVRIFGSDVAHRMADFAQRNAERAGVARAVQVRGGDALQRQPPCAAPGLILMNPPYGARIDIAGSARSRTGSHAARPGQGREHFQTPTLHRSDEAAADDFFLRLSQHWKTHFGGWSAWLLTPDRQLPARLRLKESRRIPLFNGPIECRLLRFDLTARRPAAPTAAPAAAPDERAS